jgi:hypothetical protein
VREPAAHADAIEKTAEAQADRLKSVTQEEHAEACVTAARRFFITVRGPRAHAGRPKERWSATEKI